MRPIGRMHHVVIDCPDPLALAGFYSELLGLPITYTSDDWVVVATNDTTSGLAFQRAPDHRPPAWPDPARPQQVHLDVMVDDLAVAAARVLACGARSLSTPVTKAHVYADPAGHPFCLINRPGWAPPVNACGRSARKRAGGARLDDPRREGPYRRLGCGDRIDDTDVLTPLSGFVYSDDRI